MLLDNSAAVWFNEMSDGNAHNMNNVPILQAGSAGGYFKTGRRIVCRRETPMCNLFLTMMDRMGVKMEFFGDSSGHLNGLDLA